MGTHVIDNDPAYVVFTRGTAEVVAAVRSYLLERDIIPLGRYGWWEYSSMAEVTSDAMKVADEL